MKKINKVILGSIAPLALLSTASLVTSCNNPTYGTMYYKTPELDGNDIVEIDATNFSNDLIVTLESLQGIMAQTKARIYIRGVDHTGESDAAKTSRDVWYTDLMSQHSWIPSQIIDTEQEALNFIANNKDIFHNKYVLYQNAKGTDQPDDPRDWNKSINLATTIAGVENYIMVSNEATFLPTIKGLGIEEGIDATKARSHEVFEQYKDRLNNKMILNQSPYDVPLRDYAIATKCLTIYLDDEANYFRNKVSDWMADNYPIMGWNKGELGFVASQSAYNLPVLCSDHTCNVSFFSYFKPEELIQKKQQKITADPSKHYVAIVMSDGDNLQWMQDNYIRSDRTLQRWFDSDLRGSFPMTWTITPSAYDLCPQILEYMYSEMSEQDEIIAGPSGYAYANMAQYKDTGAFASITADYMKKCDLNYVNVIDYYDCDPQKYDALFKQDQIKGAAWSERDLYLSGGGSVDWINDKPLVSMREGLWSNGATVHPELSPTAVAQRMKILYAPNIHDIDGYTIVTANAWAEGGQMTGIKEFVDTLKQDNRFEFVTLSQILDLITENVPHVHDVPENHAPYPDVPD